MYSKELEELIENVLADGVITDAERNVLRKRAEACGEDPEEVMIVVEGKLAKLNKGSQPEKRGNIIKCPNCGAAVQAGAVRCTECGYEFTNVQANQSIEKLFDMINDINIKEKDPNRREMRINSIISNFPIPTAKDDILEFLYLAVPNAAIDKSLFAKLGGGILGAIITLIAILILGFFVGLSMKRGVMEGIGMILFLLWWLPFVVGGICWYLTKEKSKALMERNKHATVWNAKCKQVIMKARFSLRDDIQTLNQIEQYAAQLGL